MFEQTIYDGRYKVERDARHRYAVTDNTTKQVLTQVPSVTTAGNMLSKPQLLPWANKIGVQTGVAAVKSEWYGQTGVGIKEVIKRGNLERKAISQTSFDRGNLIHAYLEAVIGCRISGQTFIEPTDPVLLAVQQQFDAWEANYEIEYEDTERVLFHPGENYIGTADLRLKIDGRPTILDFKTGAGVYPEYGIQLAAYAEADQQEVMESGVRDDAYYALRDRMIFHFKEGSNRGKIKSQTLIVHDESDIQKMTGCDQAGDYKAFLACLELYNWKRGGTSAWELKK